MSGDRHEILFLEAATDDPHELGGFLEALFGWRAVDDGEAVHLDAGRNVGIVVVRNGGCEVNDWLPIVRVHDVLRTTREAIEKGAVLVEDVVELPRGYRTIVQAPTGLRLALFESA